MRRLGAARRRGDDGRPRAGRRVFGARALPAAPRSRVHGVAAAIDGAIGSGTRFLTGGIDRR